MDEVGQHYFVQSATTISCSKGSLLLDKARPPAHYLLFKELDQSGDPEISCYLPLLLEQMVDVKSRANGQRPHRKL